MNKIKIAARCSGWLSLSALAGLLLAGCETSSGPAASSPTAATPPPAAPAPAAPAAASAVARPTIRIKAGSTDPVKDSEGNVWLADTGFDGGDTASRPDIKIEGTKDQALFQAEHYSMTGFTYAVPNGNYLVKLYFAETYEGISDVGQRVFSVNVQGHEIKDLDVFAKAHGAMKAYIESVPVKVTDGKVHITFTPNAENPEINAVEIIPQS